MMGRTDRISRSALDQDTFSLWGQTNRLGSGEVLRVDTLRVLVGRDEIRGLPLCDSPTATTVQAMKRWNTSGSQAPESATAAVTLQGLCAGLCSITC